MTKKHNLIRINYEVNSSTLAKKNIKWCPSVELIIVVACSIMGQQFEYNQFQRDFYHHHPEKTRLLCNQAWQLVKQAPGGSTYADYLQLIMSKKMT